MSKRLAESLLIISIILRSSSLLFTKIALQTMGPILLIGIRMLIAFVLIALIFRKELAKATRGDIIWSFLVSLALFSSMAFENIGLQTTSSSTTSFLENAIVLLVPLIACLIYRTLPTKGTVISAIIATIGLLFLSLKGTSISFTRGELFILIGTICYAMFFITTDYAAKKYNVFVISIFQLLFVGIMAFVMAGFTEEIRMPASGIEYFAMLWLAIICSGIGFTLQPVAQKHVDVDRAGLMNSLYPVSAATLGVIFLHEHIAWNAFIGCVFVILGIAYPAISKRLRGNQSN